MRNVLNLVQAFLLVVACLSAGSCSKDVKIGDYPDPAPSSINNLRRVEIKDNLVFGETSIQAVVTSDITNGNFDNKLLVIQDLTDEAAISIELSSANTSLLKDDVVTVNLKGASLIKKDGEPVLTNLPLEQIKATGEQRQLTPKSTSIAALLANAKYWGPILVKLDKVTIYNNGGDALAGDLLVDDEIAEMKVSFKPGSVFASETNPGYVESIIGIAYLNESDWMLLPRSLDDIRVGVSELLEDFEQASNTNYDSKLMNFITGSWTIDGGITATSAADPKNGKQSIRLQGTIGNSNRNGIIAMEFDLKGVKTVSVSHGIYPAAAELANTNPTVFAVEISRDGGQTYEVLGTAEVDITSTSLSTSLFQVNAGLNESVRFRVVNTSIPFANNNRPRINIDDILFTF